MKSKIKLIVNHFIYLAPVELIYQLLNSLQKKNVQNQNNWNIIDRLEFYLWAQARNWPIKKIVRLGKLVKKYHLTTIHELPGVKEIKRIRGGEYNNYFPKLLGISDGGEIKYNFEDEIFYQMSDVSFNIESDFIRKDDLVVCEKLTRKDATILVLEDFDFIARQGNNIFLKEKKKNVSLGSVFYITGVLSNFWSHFLICYYPRLAYFEQIADEEISIVVPYKLDENIKQLITDSVGCKKKIHFVEVDHDTTIFCNKLFYAKVNSYIMCHSNHASPYGIQISELTAKYLRSKFAESDIKNDKPFRKLFIARSGVRNILNYDEIFNYFKSLGFEEVIPHTLSLEQKRKIFGEAKQIVGPFSSGFTNLVFCNSGVQILAFVNYGRCHDTYVSTLSKIWESEFIFCSGTDVNADVNSDYSINLSEIDYYLKNKLN